MAGSYSHKPLTRDDAAFLHKIDESISEYTILSFANDIKQIFLSIESAGSNSERLQSWDTTKVRGWIERYYCVKYVVFKSGGSYYLTTSKADFIATQLLNERKNYQQLVKASEERETTLQNVSLLRSQQVEDHRKKEKQLQKDIEELTKRLESYQLESNRLQDRMRKQQKKINDNKAHLEDGLRVKVENYSCGRLGQTPKSIDLSSQVYHSGGSGFGAHRVRSQVNLVAQHITDNKNVDVPVGRKTTVLENIVHVDKINFFTETNELEGKKVGVQFDGSPINGMELVVVLLNWLDGEEFRQTALPPLHLFGKDSDEISTSINRLLEQLKVTVNWYSSDSENTTGATIKKLNQLRGETARQIRCSLHALNNIIKKASELTFGKLFFSQIEKVTNFVRAHWNKVNSALQELEVILNRPVKALDIRWLTHLLAASYVFENAEDLVRGIFGAWRNAKRNAEQVKTAREVKELLQNPTFLLQCGVFEAFGLYAFLPMFHWLQTKDGQRIAELPQKVRQWNYAYGLLVQERSIYFGLLYDCNELRFSSMDTLT